MPFAIHHEPQATAEKLAGRIFSAACRKRIFSAGGLFLQKLSQPVAEVGD